MKLITKTEIISNLIDTYQMQYRDNRQLFGGDWTDDIIKKLKSASPLTEKKAIEIIGNNSWTRNECHECKKDSDVVVQLGQEPDYESSTANVCLECLNKAIVLAKG